MFHKRFQPSIAFLLTAVFASLLITACAQSPLGVFQSIQLERRIVDDRALDNEIVVGAITEAGAKYFIAAATVWQRDILDADYPNDVAQWSSILSPGTSNYTSSSLVAFDGSGSEMIYAVYTSQDGTDAGLYAIDPVNPPSAVAAGDRVFGTGETDITGLGRAFVANDGTSTLLLSARKTGTSVYSVFESTTGASASFTEVDGTAGSLPVVDVAYTPGGEVFFLTRKDVLLDTDGLNAGNAAAAVAGSLVTDGRQPEFGGIFYDTDAGVLWVTDNEGYLYQSADLGDTWTSNADPHEISSNNDSALSFTDMEAVDKDGTKVLVVGTNGNGYRQLTDTFVPVTPDAEGSNYQASELAKATILTFYVDPNSTRFIPAESGETFVEATGDLLFAGTSNMGLWKALFAATEPQWVRE